MYNEVKRFYLFRKRRWADTLFDTLYHVIFILGFYSLLRGNSDFQLTYFYYYFILTHVVSLGNEELEAEAIRRMTALNREIVNIEDLNENYQVGASYFLKLKTLSFDQLWTDDLQPLLQDYIQGMYDEEGIMGRLAKAYGYKRLGEGSSDEATQN